MSTKLSMASFACFVCYPCFSLVALRAETKHTFVSMYNILLMCVIALVIREMLGNQIDAVHIITRHARSFVH